MGSEAKMAEDKLPYVMAYGVITKTLTKIKAAANPDRFTQDFLASKLGIKGGSYKSVIPYLKRTGFLASDGSPTNLYKKFRNPANSGEAAAEALKHGYKPLYERNEGAHTLGDGVLKGLIVETTGLDADGSTVKAILGSFKALKAFASFDSKSAAETPEDEDEEFVDADSGKDDDGVGGGKPATARLGLSYTINLNLPATSDVAVFNAIFKSLKDNLLK
jgi:hypothetical protein